MARSLSKNREPAAKKPFWPFFLPSFVKYTQYSPQIGKKNGSKWLPLATASILGQAPGVRRGRQARRKASRRFIWSPKALSRFAKPLLLSGLVVVLGFSGWRGYSWLTQPTTLPIRYVTLAGELKYVDPRQLRVMLTEHINVGFFSLDLMAIKRSIESLPWVYQVSLKRIWPDKLQIRVEEQRPIARWGDEGLINRYGDIYLADADTMLLELPLIVGEERRCKSLINSFNAADQWLYPLGLKLISLREDERGDQRLVLNNGTELALGRTDRGERLQRFIASYRNTLEPFMEEIARLDLRYSNGFAVKWKQDMLKTTGKTALGRS